MTRSILGYKSSAMLHNLAVNKQRFKMREFTSESIFKHRRTFRRHTGRVSLNNSSACCTVGTVVKVTACEQELQASLTLESLGPFLKCSIIMSYRFQPILLVINIIYPHKPDSLSNMCLMPQVLKMTPSLVSIWSKWPSTAQTLLLFRKSSNFCKLRRWNRWTFGRSSSQKRLPVCWMIDQINRLIVSPSRVTFLSTEKESC